MFILSRQGRWPTVLTGVAAGAAVCTVALMFCGAFGGVPEWRKRLDQDVPLFHVSPTARIPEKSAAMQSRILNDVLRRPNWGAEEARELCAVLHAGYPRSLADRRSHSREELGAAMVHSSASVAVLARLELDAPMSPEARRMILLALEEELAAEFPERRCNAAMALIVSKSIEDPFVRAQVERLTEDRDSETAEIVAMQLTHYDDQRSRALALGQRADRGE